MASYVTVEANFVRNLQPGIALTGLRPHVAGGLSPISVDRWPTILNLLKKYRFGVISSKDDPPKADSSRRGNLQVVLAMSSEIAMSRPQYAGETRDNSRCGLSSKPSRWVSPIHHNHFLTKKQGRLWGAARRCMKDERIGCLWLAEPPRGSALRTWVPRSKPGNDKYRTISLPTRLTARS